jgi:type III pantothenate kinase
MILDVDIGNTRIKWMLRDSQGQGRAGGALLPKELNALPDDIVPERVRIGSVNEAVTVELCNIIFDRWGLNAEIARVVDGAGGVKCGYIKPEALGVDRWLAVIAGWNKFPQNLLVVDAGSALTLDVVTKNGEHLGGLIIPGKDLMRTSLGLNTWGVKAAPLVSAAIDVGRETDTAVGNGILWSMVATVASVVDHYAIDRVVVTGGDGVHIKDHLALSVDLSFESALVLDGLAVALP